jgi:hypothetical protein
MSVERAKKLTKKLARSIKTERDYQGATLVAKKLLDQPARESAEERRLQALIQEMERFDHQDVDEESGYDADDINDLPSRRWSDDTSEA